jgi:hypothetical protein
MAGQREVQGVACLELCHAEVQFRFAGLVDGILPDVFDNTDDRSLAWNTTEPNLLSDRISPAKVLIDERLVDNSYGQRTLNVSCRNEAALQQPNAQDLHEIG